MAVFTKYGVALGAGPIEIGLNAIRLGTMGRAAHPQMVLPSLAALGCCLPLLGHDCSPQAGVEAARAVFDRESPVSLWEFDGDGNLD
jgi:aspartate aminotransferase-like enzyme